MSIFRNHFGILYLGSVLAVALASIPVAETAFRFLGDEPSADLQGLYQPFAGDNYKLGAQVNTGASLASGNISVHTDDLGLRCDYERKLGLTKGARLDYLIVGDSQGFGNGLNFEETIAGSFAMHAANSGIRVANASVGGHSLASQLEVVRWLVDEQQLKIRNYVILFSPALIENSNKLNHVTVGRDGRIYGSIPGMRTKTLLWMKSHLVTYSRIRDAVRNLGIGADPAKGSPTVFQFYRTDQADNSTTSRLLEALAEFQKFAVQKGAEIHAVYIPLTVEAEFDSVLAAAAAAGVNLDADLPSKRCESVSNRLGMRTFNLKQVAGRVRRDGESLTVKADFHYSAALSKACGAELWNALSAINLNPPAIHN